MKDLTPYAEAFDRAYPDYATERYQDILALTGRLADPHWLGFIETPDFDRFAALMAPLIAIKNYKSQVPFPTDLKVVIRCLIEIKQGMPREGLTSEEMRGLFLALIEQTGIQLPTLSALLHFCHPNDFPIVDRNVEAACEILKDRYPADFENVDAPTLPGATTSGGNKLSKYCSFISFIGRVRDLQKAIQGHGVNYRFIDQALMVLGVDRLRRQVEERAPSIAAKS